ncbi:DNA-binding transcriptional MerR regulator [Prauserella shujinwangii]|uniref:DNA-binding transcriptional MerR regulator n=1 Tax=Prauserella shujinwangii TaxID=1453103 RepID=A0A2T0LSN8_9PSEU|nr:MerR family transcriptional regulator [Prauserella shujinwangii]PRX46687.1 DNA-binding transcriptional MerR regulator [Prauserella shujinwangii]
MGEHMQIGEVAERTELSLRTIRYYEEVGLVIPSARSQGGFRLYTEPDVERLLLVKRMKPLGFQLDEMRELLELLDPGTGARRRLRKEDRERLRGFTDVAEERCTELRAKLHSAEEFAEMLREQLARQRVNTARA